MEFGILGKKALVTGADSELAGAVAAQLAEEGAILTVVGRDEKALRAAIDGTGNARSGHRVIIADLAGSEKPDEEALKVRKEAGEMDIVVNCLEEIEGDTDPCCSITQWRKVFNANMESIIAVNNHFIPAMKEKGWGRVVNISSIASFEHSGTVQFAASKAALTAYTRCMGRILAVESKNVVMSAVLPGSVMMKDGPWEKFLKEKPEEAKKFINQNCPLGRFGKVEEVAPMVVFLASELATLCQGAIVPVDGGQAKNYFQT